jgi:hypothetical protein
MQVGKYKVEEGEKKGHEQQNNMKEVRKESERKYDVKTSRKKEEKVK